MSQRANPEAITVAREVESAPWPAHPQLSTDSVEDGWSPQRESQGAVTTGRGMTTGRGSQAAFTTVALPPQ